MSETTNLILQTTPSRRAREGFTPMLVPHDAIRGISRAAERHSRSIGSLVLRLPQTAATRLIAYKNQYYDDTGRAVRETNCAQFALYMAGRAVEGAAAAARALDGITGTITEPTELAAGHLGVVASSEPFADPENFNHFLHAGISVGNGRWLAVTGLNADLAVTTIADEMPYYRRHVGIWYGDRFRPDAVQLYDRGAIAW